jgi:hypothetical protein
MRKLLAELRKLAITFEEYKKLHPKTRKTPDDPMFSMGKDPKKTQAPDPSQPPQSEAVEKKPRRKRSPAQSQETQSAPKEHSRQIKKPTSEMTDDELIERYKPQFSGSAYQKKMSVKELNANASKMSADDLAWHLCNSKFEEEGEFTKYVRDKIGRSNIYLMQLFNTSLTKKERTETANYILDKAGVSFVGGRTLNRFMAALSRKGLIDKAFERASQNDELRSQLYYGGISDPNEIRKYASQTENGKKKWSYQLKNNPHTPSDVLERMYFESDMSQYRDEIMNHPNFPIETLLRVAGRDNTRVFWNRADTPKDLQDRLFEQYSSPVAKPKKGYYGSIRPPKFDLTEDQFMKLWEKTSQAHKTQMEENKKNNSMIYSTDTEYGLEDWAQHPKCPEKVLREILAWENRKDKEGVTQFSISRAKAKAYKNLVAQKKLSQKEIVSKVKSTLNLHGDDAILQQFGERAFCAENNPNPIKRTIAKVSPEERQRIQDEMNKTAVHDDFDFEIVEAYEVDKEPHKDFSEVEKKINNVLRGVYHGTSFSNAAGIMADGVNTHSKSRTGQMFGEGFYIASASSKAVQYASDNFSKDEGEGVVFVLDVSLGKTSEMKYGRPVNDDLERNSWQDGITEMKEEYKKRTGVETNTRWHLDYDSVTAKAGQSLDHDEYVVKDGTQIQIKRIIHVRKKPKAK